MCQLDLSMTKLGLINKTSLKEEKLLLEGVLNDLKSVDTSDASKQAKYLQEKDNAERRLAEIAVELRQSEEAEVKEFLRNLDKEGPGSK